MRNNFYSYSWCLVLLLSAPVFAGSPLNACAAAKLQATKDISQIKNQWVYVDFWASWCGPCRDTFPFMNQLQKKYQNRLSVIAISVDANIDDAKKFMRSYPANFSVYIDKDGVCPAAFKVKGMPSSYLISPRGEVIFSETGFKKNSKQKIVSAIERAISKNEN